MIDPGDAGARAHADIHSHRFGAEEPAPALHADRDPVWFAHFRREYEQIWSAGRPATR